MQTVWVCARLRVAGAYSVVRFHTLRATSGSVPWALGCSWQHTAQTLWCRCPTVLHSGRVECDMVTLDLEPDQMNRTTHRWVFDDVGCAEATFAINLQVDPTVDTCLSSLAH